MEPIDLSIVRRSQRAVRSLSIKLLVESQGQQIEHSAYTLDISNEGARVRADVELKAGETVGVLPREKCRTVLRSRVVWVGGPGSKHEGEAGLKFLSVAFIWLTAHFDLTRHPPHRFIAAQHGLV